MILRIATDLMEAATVIAAIWIGTKCALLVWHERDQWREAMRPTPAVVERSYVKFVQLTEEEMTSRFGEPVYGALPTYDPLRVRFGKDEAMLYDWNNES